MCTALSMTTRDRYFGRTLDLDRSYGEEVCILPRSFPLSFRRRGAFSRHHAMIGMATVADGIPLFYEAANEHGLAIAGLNFPGNAYYEKESACKEGMEVIAPFELIPRLLAEARTTEEAARILSRMAIADISFSEMLPPSPLHWMLTDGERDIVIEAMRGGIRIYENPVGVLTNNPPFRQQLENLKKYADLRNDNRDVARERASDSAYSQGLGACGLPGDVSSMSRFVRASFARAHSVCDGDEASSVGQFFHLLGSVEMPRGICKTDEGSYDITVYTACINLSRGRYYYTTYGNRRITRIDLRQADLESPCLLRYPLLKTEDIRLQNG